MNAQDLKNSILQLAIQGKLVEQREEEGTAKELIQKIKSEKKQLIKEGRIKNEKPFPKIEEDEKPFDVPENWEWIRFGDLGSYRKGPFGSALTKALFVPKSENTVKVYEQKNAIQKDVNLGDYYITRDYFESKMKGFELSPGDIIVSCAGTIGETYVMPEDFEQGIINQALMQMKLTPSVDVVYFLMYFDFILKKTARKSSKGSAIKNIPPFAELKNYVVPLSPLEEQKRIVAKIEELMPYVDKYDIAYSEVEELNKKFPEDMQKSILQYAIHGKLVEQREEDGTAEELYQQIQEEKKKLIKEGKIKKTKALLEIAEDEIPFDIPESWKWVRLGDITHNWGQKKPDKTFDYIDVGSIDNINGMLSEEENLIEPKDAPSRARKIVKEGSVLYSTVRPYLLNICIMDKEFKHEPIASTAFAILQPIEGLHNKYLYFILKSPMFISYVSSVMIGVAYPAINGTNLLAGLIPLPPLNEQKRIVEKIEELLPYAKQLIR